MDRYERIIALHRILRGARYVEKEQWHKHQHGSWLANGSSEL